MPPGPVYNWLAVAQSALVILDHALKHRAAQVARVGGIPSSQSQKRTRGPDESKQGEEDAKERVSTTDESHSQGSSTYVLPNSLLYANEAWLKQIEVVATPLASLLETALEPQLRHERIESSKPREPNTTLAALPTTAEVGPHAADSFTLSADTNLSRLDVPSSQDLHIPGSYAPPHDVHPCRHLCCRNI
jgi:hypothetical protein